ncbi:hypothetical protein B0T44_08620 [Nocardia donostiensis]|uniref:Glycosyl hydrolase family 32 N-terminal domain-containing protein n=2 Tax=Nocardia donostiensis TaxID=1538463 RepID=A0A1W0BFE5_9NOCA|nr:hypothetical protein B0T46_18690 [Nocardia donostiensis]OQS16930.1 hypothetical protein B0T36_02640 [Nocardia donostiensis]OQS21138.1 hypothetical protein B0T44_08620 [Nocardia donostiensis]
MLGDPRAGHGVLGVSDPDVHCIDGRWVMFLGAMTTRFVIRIIEARLPVGRTPTTSDEWQLVTNTRSKAVQHGAPLRRRAWDHAGMHTPSYVEGIVNGRTVRRIYYAGQATRTGTGPRSRYAIGALELRDGAWCRREHPVLTGDTERPSAMEPRVIYADGCWHMWYCATIGEVGRGARPDYEMRYCTSADGLTWSPPVVFFDSGDGYFDNAVAAVDDHWEMIVARGTNLHGTQPFPPQGLWWAHAAELSGDRRTWSPLTRVLDTDTEPQDWYAAGICGPSFVWDADTDGNDVLHIFGTGTRAKTRWWPTAMEHIRRRKMPPVPSPFYLATGRLSLYGVREELGPVK